MRKLYFSLIFGLLFVSVLSAQMVNGLDTLYGNEWIETTNPHLKLTVSTDGFYRVNYATLQAQGWPVGTIGSEEYRFFHAGEPVLYHSTAAVGSPLGVDDYLVFYGEHNRGDLDHYLYRSPAVQQLNPEHSLYTNDAAYYLTWATGAGGNRYTTFTNDLTDLPAAETYVWRQAEEVFTEHFMKEYYRFSGSTIYYSHFSIGEGYGNRSINELLGDGSTQQSVELELPAAYAAGPQPVLRTRYVGALFEHIQQLRADDNLVRTDSFFNWELQNVEAALPAGVLTDEAVNISWDGLGGPKDEVSVGFVQIDYPARPDAGGGTTYRCRLSTTGSRQYLEIDNFEASAAVIYDLANAQRIVVTDISDGLLRVSLPPASNERQLRIVAQDDLASVPPVDAVNLQVPDLNDTEYVLLTHSLLRAGDDAVQAYADYRASSIGGGYRTAVVNIDDLYDQFAYGVQQHALAIRNFVAWQRRINPDFEFLFVIGKGREYLDMRAPEDLAEALGNTLFVPSFGFPASDNLLVAGLEKPTPLVNIGRLPAVNPVEVRLYLNKIQGMETFVANSPQTIEGKSWMKNVLHLGGGSTASEQQSIKNNLDGMAEEVEEGVFGGRTTSVYKTSTDPIQSSLTDQIFTRINEGVSLLTFFGHSSAGTFDFSIDNPDNYHNVNKYPLMLSLGCYSGNMFDDFRSIGERFIFLENGGAGAYGASRGLGFIHSLSNFGNYFYERASNDFYGRPIGELLRVTIAHYEDFTDQAYGTLNEQFTLQGDPAMRLHPAPGPDYTFVGEETKLVPSIVNAQKDSFSVKLQLRNLGTHQEDSLELRIGRAFPDGTVRDDLQRIRVAAPPYGEEVTLRLPTAGKDGVGINTLFVEVNAAELDPILELPLPTAANNNLLQSSGGSPGYSFFILDNTALPVWPPRYALVGAEELTLKASTADALAPERKYFLQLDTMPYFDAPLTTTTIVQEGGVINWKPTVNWQDGTVYYWRVTPDSLDIGTPDYVWEESSFTYLSDVPSGWGQGHWGQYAENDLANLEIEPNEQFDFAVNVRNLAIRNVIYSVGNADNLRPQGLMDGRRWSDFFRWDVRPSMQVVVFDTVGNVWTNANPGQYGSVNTSTQNPIAAFSFPVETTEQRGNIINFINEIIPDNHTVLVYNAIRNTSQDLWIGDWAADSISLDGVNLFNLLETHGAQRIRELAVGPMRPYLLSFKKGGAVLDEELATEQEEYLFYNIDLPGRWTNGEMYTSDIGPARAWEELVWETPLEGVEDTVKIQLQGIRPDGSTLVLMDSVAHSGNLDLSFVSATEFPKLRLNFYGEDRFNKTSPQLAYWRIYHQGIPDLAIDRNTAYRFSKDTLQQGEALDLEIGVVNISDEDIGATSATFKLQSQGQEDDEWQVALPALAAGEEHVITTSRSTEKLKNLSQLSLTVNPADEPQERLRINNQAVKDFMVASDEIEPVVDVAFDGRSILDGDLVSARPFVTIAITDENEFLLLEDTSLFELRLRDPLGNSQPIALDAPSTRFEPASDPQNNVARIEWEPVFTQDGEYLLQVRGKDQSNNQGRLLHEVRFEIITQQMLSNVLPYPNPFSTSTRFVYTLTGDRSPDQYKIQIMTISGRIVREINQQELGPLRVGTHLTDFVWDGTDTYGDQLAVGTYLYRVIALDEEGSDLDRYDNGTDRFFKNQIGKIVILR